MRVCILFCCSSSFTVAQNTQKHLSSYQMLLYYTKYQYTQRILYFIFCSFMYIGSAPQYCLNSHVVAPFLLWAPILPKILCYSVVCRIKDIRYWHFFFSFSLFSLGGHGRYVCSTPIYQYFMTKQNHSKCCVLHLL